MCWSSITGLTCLLYCVVMSAGRVSPPQNLNVVFLDFRGEVNWSPGIGNPPNTTYTVEMQLIGEEWSRLETCTNIELTSCPLIFNLTMNDLMESYYVRVKASWRADSSSWTSLDTVQPYGNTLLSAPTLDVSIQESDIYVHVQMPQVVLSMLPNLRYNVQVYESNSGDHEKCMMLRESSYVCTNLSLGQRYCVRASAIHKQQQTKPHHSREKCVDLPGNISDKPKHVAIATILVLLVIIALIIAIMYIYTKPRASDLNIPSSLEAVGGAGRAVVPIPAEAPCLLASLCVINTSLTSGITLPAYQSSCNWGYECRVAPSCLDLTADLPLELEEQHILTPCLYSGALDEDEQGDRVSDGETQNAQPLFEEGDWQLDQGSPCLDVPMSSLCLDSGEPWDSCGESGSIGEDEAEMDLGAKLLGQSWRNSMGDQSGELESIGSSTCSPSPTFGQSVLYLQR